MDKTVDEMSLFELSRWCALMEGVNLIADKCDDCGEDFEKIELEPLSLRKYVEGTCDNIFKQLESDENKRKQKEKFQTVSIIPGKIFDTIFEEDTIKIGL